MGGLLLPRYVSHKVRIASLTDFTAPERSIRLGLGVGGSALLARPGPDSDPAPVPLRMAGVGGVAGAASGGGVRGASESRALTAENDDIVASVPED